MKAWNTKLMKFKHLHGGFKQRNESKAKEVVVIENHIAKCKI